MPEIQHHRPGIDTDTTRRVAHHLVDAMSGGGGIGDLFHDTAFWVSGSYWWSGDLTAAKAARIQSQFHQCLRGGSAGLTRKVHAIVADGNKASIEMLISGTWHDGRRFAKPLHIAIDVEGEKIVSYREYGCDEEFFAREPEPPTDSDGRAATSDAGPV